VDKISNIYILKLVLQAQYEQHANPFIEFTHSLIATDGAIEPAVLRYSRTALRRSNIGWYRATDKGSDSL
jgi:hypothetical protein